MAPSSSSQDPAKARIISHMNADHADSLSRYLEHHFHLSGVKAQNATLKDMSFRNLQITLPNDLTVYMIPLSPPLTSWSQARERLVALDKQVLADLLRDPLTITHWESPQGVEALVWLSFFIAFLVLSRRANLLPASQNDMPILKDLAAKFPTAFDWLYRVQPKLFYGLLGAHVAEIFYLDIFKLTKHGIPRFGGLWWKYVLTHLIEGFPSFQRFDRYVAKEKKRQQAAADKHNQKH